MQEQKNDENKTNNNKKEIWQTPKIEILPVPDITKSGQNPGGPFEIGSYGS